VFGSGGGGKLCLFRILMLCSMFVCFVWLRWTRVQDSSDSVFSFCCLGRVEGLEIGSAARLRCISAARWSA
jgi:hypothetical protein